MIELIRHAHHARLRSTIVWGLAVGFTSALLLASFLAFDAEQLAEIAKTFSPELQEAFGMTETSMTSPAGYLAGQLLNYLPLALGFYAITAGSRAIAGQEQDRTLDLIAAQPVPRWKLPVATLAAVAIGLLEVLVFYVVLTWLTAIVTGIDLALGDLVISALGLIPITLLYGGLALAGSAAFRRPGTVTASCGALLVIAYLANTIAALVPDLSWVKWTTPFSYYGSPIERGLDAGDQGLLLAGAVLLLLASLPLYARRDIRA